MRQTDSHRDIKALLLLGGFCLLLGAFKMWLVEDQGILVGEKFSAAWSQVQGAYWLVHGNWLGDSNWWALYRPPGYPLWIAFTHQLHLPLRLAAELLLALSALTLVFSLRFARAPLWLCLALFYAVVFHPITFSLGQKASSLNLGFPLLLLSFSACFLMIWEPRRGWSFVYGLGAGFFLACFWVSTGQKTPVMLLLGWVFLWKLFASLRRDNFANLRNRLRGACLAVLIPILVIAGADFSLRYVNKIHYGEFALEKHFSSGLLNSSNVDKLPPLPELFQTMTHQSSIPIEPHILKIVGWAVDFRGPVQRVEVLDEHRRVIGKAEKFESRADIQGYFEALSKKHIVTDLGYKIATEKTFSDQGLLKVAFYNNRGDKVEIPVQNDFQSGDDFRYHLDLVEMKVPAHELRSQIIEINQEWYERANGALFFAAWLAVFYLAMGYFFQSIDLQPVDFLLAIFSLFIFVISGEYLLIRADRFLPEEMRNYEWWTAAIPCLGLLLMFRGIRALERLAKSAEQIRSRALAFLGGLRPEKVFIILALSVGSLYVFLNPPFQAPDEEAHAFRSFQISQGGSGRAEIPESVGTLVEKFGFLSFHSENKISWKDLLDGFRIPLNDHQRKYLGSIYGTFISYLPQGLGILLGRLFKLPPLALVYFGRLFNLAAWAALVYGAIRRSPLFRWGIFFLALSPMAIYQAASLSHDAFTNGIAFFTISTFLLFAFDESKESLSLWDRVLLVSLGILVSFSKAVYFLTVFLYFLIPVRKLGSRQRFVLVFFLLFGFSFGVDFLWNYWNGVVAGLQGAGGRPSQMGFVKSNPWQFMKILVNTYWAYGSFYLESFIGKLGWLDTALPTSIRTFFAMCLVSIAVLDHNLKYRLNFYKKMLIFLICLGTTLLLSLALYTTWTPIGKDIIEGIQGRYFIPLSPMVCLLLYNRRVIPKFQSGIIFSWIPLASLLILISTLLVMVNRYYYL